VLLFVKKALNLLRYIQKGNYYDIFVSFCTRFTYGDV